MAQEASPPESGYPPAQHMLRDLGIWVEDGPETSVAGLPVVPELFGGAGAVGAGVLATLADVASGGLALATARPGWVATSDLSVHVHAPVTAGELRAHARVARKGRATIVIEAELRGQGGRVGHAVLSFAVLEARAGFQARTQAEPERNAKPDRFAFALEGSGLRAPFAEALGIRSATDGGAEIAVTPYHSNSLGALQGGALAMLVDTAVERRASAELGEQAATTDLTLRYLALGRRGPIRASVSPLRSHAESGLYDVRVVDGGAENRLLSIASAHASAHR